MPTDAREGALVHYVTKIRKAVRYVTSFLGRLDQFKKCGGRENILQKPSLDVETRWNSTYLMLGSAAKCEKAFFRLAKDNKSYLSHFSEAGIPNEQDWTYAREFIATLRTFCDLTVRLCLV